MLVPTGEKSSETFTFSSISCGTRLAHTLASIVLTEKLYARNPFDRRHDFAAYGCIVTGLHDRPSVDHRGGELEPQQR